MNCYQHLLDGIQETGAEKEKVTKKRKLLQKREKDGEMITLSGDTSTDGGVKEISSKSEDVLFFDRFQ